MEGPASGYASSAARIDGQGRCVSNPVFKSVRQDMKEAIAHVETELLARDAKRCLNAALPEDVQDMQEGKAAKAIYR